MHRLRLVSVAILFFALVSPAFADAGLDFPGNNDVPDGQTIRFRFVDPQNHGLPIYGANGAGVTYIWRAYPRQQSGYFTAFFWSGDVSSFGATFNYFYGAHPYPQPPPSGNLHKWEISVNQGDILSTDPVEYDRWHTQAFVAYGGVGQNKVHAYYYDLPDLSKVVTHTVTESGYGETLPPNPALTWGDAPWASGKEVWDGVIRGMQIYSARLSESEILNEINDPLSTTDGANNIWYLNLNPTPTDIADDSGQGNHPQWVGSNRPTLWGVDGSPADPPEPPANLDVE